MIDCITNHPVGEFHRTAVAESERIMTRLTAPLQDIYYDSQFVAQQSTSSGHHAQQTTRNASTMSFFNLPRRSSSTGPTFGGSRGRDSIYVIRTSHQVDFVHPPRPNARRDTDGWDWVLDAPREDTTCSGIVEVNLARPRRVKCLGVRFITWARLHYPSVCQRLQARLSADHSRSDRIPKTEILFQKKLVLAEGCPEKGMLLEAGKHRSVHEMLQNHTAYALRLGSASNSCL